MSLPIRAGFGAIVLFLLFMPWAPAAILRSHAYNESRIAQLVLFGFCALMLVLDRGKAIEALLPRSRATRALAAVACASMAASVWSAHSTGWALRDLGLWIGWAGVVVIVSRGVGDQARKQLQYMLFSVLVIMALVTISGLTLAVLQGHPALWSPKAFHQGYANHRLLNHTQTILIPLATLGLLSGTRPVTAAGRLFVTTALGLNWALLFHAMGRASLLALGIGAVAVVILYRSTGALALRRSAPALILGVCLWGGLFVALPGYLGAVQPAGSIDHLVAADDSGRLWLWHVAWSQFMSHPLLGAGGMHLANETVYRLLPPPNGAHPHNVYLQLLAEWGILTTAAIAWALMTLVRRVVVRTRQAIAMGETESGNEGVFISLALLAVLVDVALSSTMATPVPMVWAALPVGLGLAYVNRTEANEARAPSPLRRGQIARHITGLVACAFLAINASTWWQIRHDVSDLRAMSVQTGKNFPARRLTPRFWAHGWWK